MSILLAPLRCGFTFCPYTDFHTILIQARFNCSPVIKQETQLLRVFSVHLESPFLNLKMLASCGRGGEKKKKNRNSCFSLKDLWSMSKNHYWQTQRDSPLLQLHPKKKTKTPPLSYQFKRHTVRDSFRKNYGEESKPLFRSFLI